MKDLLPEIQLNSYQEAAVRDEARALMVNACVGSGKTTVLTEKVRYLHREKKVPYEHMMVLTFTNRAADEIRQRLGLAALREEAGTHAEDGTYTKPETDGLYFGTFHHAARMLLCESPLLEQYGRTADFTILEPEEEMLAAQELIAAHKLKVKYKNRLRKRLEYERESCLAGGPGKYKDDIPKLFSLLEEKKKAENKMTFSDLLEICTRILREKPFYPDWIIVDEVQDCNKKQMEFLKLLYGPNTHFFAVGDPNQMIYSFRGSEETLFYQLKYEFNAKEVSLPINYRSDAQILELANRFRQFGEKINSGAQYPEADRRIAIREYYDPFLEAEVLAERIQRLHEEGTPYEQIAVLYRLSQQKEKLAKAFERNGIEGVQLMTVHASKGLEFDIVFLVGLNKGLFPIASGDETSFSEEQRLFFVGITRARKRLEITWYTNPDQVQAVGQPSPFLERIPRELVLCEERSDKEKRENLQNLRKLVRQEIEAKQKEIAEVNPVETEEIQEPAFSKRVRHPKYGEGILIREDDMVWEAEFSGYGRKEFMKLFEPLEMYIL